MASTLEDRLYAQASLEFEASLRHIDTLAYTSARERLREGIRLVRLAAKSALLDCCIAL